MRNIGEAFRFPPIDRLHIERIRDIGHVLWGKGFEHPDDGTPPHRGHAYAVAHHLLEGAEKAARKADEETLAWYQAAPLSGDPAWRHDANTSPPRIVMAPDVALLENSAISETPYMVLGPFTQAADPAKQFLARDAISMASRTGFGHLVEQHGSVVCLLRHRSLEQTLDSWTISRLPGTVFIDYTDDATVLGRDIIHEAGHNWLNDALVACAITFDPAAEFYSPWKGTMRPAFGFIHACWSFPLMMLYTSQVIDSVPPMVRGYLRAYLSQQREFLRGTTKDFAEALKLVHDNDLSDRLAVVYDAARAV